MNDFGIFEILILQTLVSDEQLRVEAIGFEYTVTLSNVNIEKKG